MDQPLHYPSDVAKWIYKDGKSPVLEGSKQHSNRLMYEKAEHYQSKLNTLVSHYSPSLYVPYCGPLSDAPESIAKLWPEGSSYGFKEWKEWAGWLVKLCMNYPRKPILPYISPYVIQLDAKGKYGLGYRKYPVPWFGEMVEWVSDACDGFFLHAWDEMDLPIEQNVRRVIERAIG